MNAWQILAGRRMQASRQLWGRWGFLSVLALGMTCGAAQAQNLVATVTAGTGPTGVAVNQTTNTIYVADNTVNTLLVIDGATNATSTIQAGAPLAGVAVNPITNTVYALTNATPGSVVVIDGATSTVTTTVTLPSAASVIEVNSATNQIYVGEQDDVAVIDGATNAVTTNISVPQAVSSLVVDSSRNVVWALYGVSGSDSTLAQINGATNTIANTVQVGSGDTGFALNASTNTLYVSDAAGNQMFVIDGATVAITDTVSVGNISAAPPGINPVTNTIYVVNCRGNIYEPCLVYGVNVVDGATNAITAVVSAPSYGYLLVDSVTNNVVLESNYDVFFIDGATNIGTEVSGTSGVAGFVNGAVNTTTNTAYLPEPGNVLVISAGTAAPAPAFSAAPSPLAFGNQTEGTESKASTLTVTNTGTASLSITNVVEGGTDQADFLVSSDGCNGQTVTAGSQCTLSVAFMPSTSAAESATLTFTDNAAGSPQVVKLTGTGTPPPPTVSTTSLPSGLVGAAYSQTLAATGGVKPYTWSISAGTLPAGLSLAASTGIISGTPTAAGTSAFTVKVTDSASNSATESLSITINATLAVTTASLPGGKVGTAYSQTLAATGGVSPYTWSISAGTLPGGLALAASTGAITGMPTTAATSTFTVEVSDSASHTATQNLSIAIAAATPTASTTKLTASATSVSVGTSVTFTATVAPASGTPTPTGTVTFKDGATTLGTGTLNSSGVATYSTASLAIAAHSITANYAGDSRNLASASSTVTVTVTLGATTTALTASATSLAVGTSVTFTATVTGASGVPAPTGNVTFMNGTTTLGTGTVSSGTATYTTSTLIAGSYSVTAVYAGDANNAASTSSAVAVTVWPGPPNFTVSLSPTSGSAGSGKPATTTLTVTSVNGFATATTLSCGNLPKDTICSFSESSITPDVGGTATATVTIKTDTNPATAALDRQVRGGESQPGHTGARFSLAGAVGVFLLLPLLGGRSRKVRRMLLSCSGLILLAAITCIGMSGCGGGPTTPNGTYSVQVTATAGSITQTATFSLTVQ
ncbi:MAG: Ig-like domain repeat protein [Acidobacteriaceae bacterium]